ncbi:PEP-CTERM sorting domain-containing protein [Psychrosphaera aestuarii]|uniref:PEP-CTERM sorting domain-containing protein n=1 Tax=Psychrosphaera aestuarii TaxID=1266052 RepID=UPI001B3426AE|nr:PEP-CTERM sorting domain-containing protein [Psychrosphaera aestuarii]
MSVNKQISPISMGAIGLTLGMSLVNPAQASIIAGDDSGFEVISSQDITVDAMLDPTPSNYEYQSSDGTYSYVNQWFRQTAFVNILTKEVTLFESGEDYFGEDGEDSRAITLDQVGFWIYDSYSIFSNINTDPNNSYVTNATSLYGDVYSNNSQLIFSTSPCSRVFSGEDFSGEDCVSNLNQGTTIDASWFDGSNANYNYGGKLYGEWDSTRTYEDGTIEEDSSKFSNWLEGETGYIAFAYNTSVDAYEYAAPNWINSSDTTFGFLEVTRGSISVSNIVTSNVTSVPEPSSYALFTLGLFGLVARKLIKTK